MEDAPVILSIQDLSISFPRRNEEPFIAVHNLSFNLRAGSTLAVVGESGSGKSLTALALMGLLPKEARVSGSINFSYEAGAYNLADTHGAIPWAALRGNAMGMVFQEPMSALNPIMTIGRQLTEAILVHRKTDKNQARALAIELLTRVQLPTPARLYKRYPHQLSGGQKQRVMIAMAMCNNPILLIADEPTTALDVTVQREVLELMRALQQDTGAATIFITHDLALASEMADEVLVMYKGEVQEYGTVEKVLHHPEHPYTQALIACRPGVAQKGYRLPVVEDFLHPRETIPPPAKSELKTKPAAAHSSLLEVRNLKVWFAEDTDWLGRPGEYFKAVDDVSFTLQRGEVLGLVGESGCGKSTLGRSLMGLVPVHEGQIIFNGKDLTHLSASERRALSRQIQMVFQDPFASLNPRISVADMLAEPLRVHHIVPQNEVNNEIARLLSLVQLPAEAAKRYPHQFSGGQRQRLVIARALAMRPQLLICDESVSALDVSVQAQILNLLNDLKDEFGLTYLFVSHDLSVVHYLADRVMVMRAGKIVEAGGAEDVLRHPHNAYTQTLVRAIPRLK